MLSVTCKTFMQTVIILNADMLCVIMLSVVAPLFFVPVGRAIVFVLNKFTKASLIFARKTRNLQENHNASFSSLIMNMLNRLECYITLSWKGLPVTNTLTYRACS